MRKLYQVIAVLLISNMAVYAQRPDSTYGQTKLQYYKKALSVNDEQAGKLHAVQESYKAAARRVVADTSLSAADKQKVIEQLISEKNDKLKNVLNADQLDILVPTSERKRARADQHSKSLVASRRDTSDHKAFISKSLAIPQDKAQQVTIVMMSYKENARRLAADSTVAGKDKKLRFDQLMKERNRRLKQLLTPAQVSRLIPAAEQKL